jgi:hypothetical protein
MNYTVPFLLGVDGLSDKILKKFNTLKKQHNSNWVSIEDKYSIPNTVRADPLWAKILPRADYLSGSDCAGGCKWDLICGHKSRYVLIPVQFSQYMEIIHENEAETCYINFDKYIACAIRTILDDSTLTDSERIEKIKGVYAFIETHKGCASFKYASS